MVFSTSLGGSRVGGASEMWAWLLGGGVLLKLFPPGVLPVLNRTDHHCGR